MEAKIFVNLPFETGIEEFAPKTNCDTSKSPEAIVYLSCMPARTVKEKKSAINKN